MSMREFINSKSPKTVIDTALVVGYYLEEYLKKPSFTSDDLSKGFINAKEKPPTNPSDMLAKNAKRGFIMEAPEQKDGPKAWMLTNTGIKYIENGLSELPSS